MINDILIVISLRGAADALNMVVPYREDNYYRLRPTLAIARPGSTADGAIDLDGRSAIHPALAPLLSLYQRKELAILQAVGWPGDSHSHFEAWAEIESGTLGPERANTGWLARYLQARGATTNSPMRAVAFGEMLPKLLIGALGVSTLRNLSDFQLQTKRSKQAGNVLRQLYHGSNTPISTIGVSTIEALQTIEHLSAQTEAESRYPKTEFGRQLSALEHLIRADVGLEAASLELNGWDTHIMQGATKGHMANLMSELANGLAVFTNNLADQMGRIIIVVMTEFGRRVIENSSNGTDHGQGGLMFFIGKQVNGGAVYGDWPGLADAQLAGPGDLAITRDFRDPLSALVNAKLGNSAARKIFPDYQGNFAHQPISAQLFSL